MLVQPGDGAYHLRDVVDPESGRRLVIWHQSSCDNYNQVIDARLIVDELDESGVAVGRFYRDFRLRYAHRWEIHHLLTSVGLRGRRPVRRLRPHAVRRGQRGDGLDGPAEGWLTTEGTEVCWS